MKGTKRPGRGFVADYYIGATRVRKSFKTAALRNAHLDEAREKVRRAKGLSRAVDRAKTVAALALDWLATVEGGIARNTLDAYRKAVELYIVPRLGNLLVIDLTREEIKAFLVDCRKLGVGYVKRSRHKDGSLYEERVQKPLGKGSVYAIYAALRALLNEGVELGLLVGNPAAKLGRKLHLHPTKQHMKAKVEGRVLSREKLRHFLEYVRRHAGEAYPLLLTLARCGLRIGELVALRLDDYEPEAHKLLIARKWNHKHKCLEAPKHGARRVDVSPQLAAVLNAHVAGLRKIVALTGVPKTGEWLFPSEAGTMLDPRNVRRLLTQLATDAALGRGLGPHDLRHTYGSQLTAQGVPPQYIQAQMGHASIQITIDLYGSGLPVSYQHAVAGLDDAPTKGRSRAIHGGNSARTGHKPVTSGRMVAKGGGVSG